MFSRKQWTRVVLLKKTTFFEWSPPTDHLCNIYSDTDTFSGILSDIYFDILSDILPGILSGIHPGILSGIHSDVLSDILSYSLSDILCDILHWQLRSGSAHWDLELAVEAKTEAEEGKAEVGWPALIKSRDPHLAGREKRR